MLGDAYFQLRAQVGTGLFSLLRLAVEAGARESTLEALRVAQAGLRGSLTFAALGPPGAGKSTLLNTLFDREFCGAAEPAAGGRIAVFRYDDEARDDVFPEDAVVLYRPHIFLRDFTIVEAPGGAAAEAVGPHLTRADLIFYVISAAAGPADAWPFLSRLGREVLKRLVFVVWQSDRVSAEEGANSVKRLRQAMLKNLGQACPIFIGSTADRAGREKLERWIESEVILSAPRRAKLREIDEVAREALREIVNKPRADRQALERKREQVRNLKADLAERAEQAERQVAGALWTLAQSADGLRRHGESLLRAHIGPLDLLWKRSLAAQDFAEEIETQTRASLTVQLHDQMILLEADLRASAAEYFRESGELLPGAATAKLPEFPRASLEEVLIALEPPLQVARVVQEAFSDGVRTLQLPLLGGLGALAVALGAALAGQASGVTLGLAGAVAAFVLLLAFLLRQNVVAAFGRDFTDNRATLLGMLDPHLRLAVEHFYTGVAPTLEARAEQLEGEGQRHEPLLAQLQQIEETFSRIAEDLRAGLSRSGE
ncbi:MAG: GTPase domain-containing protein [Chthoniobacter sp.]